MYNRLATKRNAEFGNEYIEDSFEILYYDKEANPVEVDIASSSTTSEECGERSPETPDSFSGDHLTDRSTAINYRKICVPNRIIPRPNNRELRSEVLSNWQKANLSKGRCSKTYLRLVEKSPSVEPVTASFNYRNCDRKFMRKYLARGLTEMGIHCLQDKNNASESYHSKGNQSEVIETNKSALPINRKSNTTRENVCPYVCTSKAYNENENDLRLHSLKNTLLGKINNLCPRLPIKCKYLFKMLFNSKPSFGLKAKLHIGFVMNEDVTYYTKVIDTSLFALPSFITVQQAITKTNPKRIHNKRAINPKDIDPLPPCPKPKTIAKGDPPSVKRNKRELLKVVPTEQRNCETVVPKINNDTVEFEVSAQQTITPKWTSSNELQTVERKETNAEALYLQYTGSTTCEKITQMESEFNEIDYNAEAATLPEIYYETDAGQSSFISDIFKEQLSENPSSDAITDSSRDCVNFSEGFTYLSLECIQFDVSQKIPSVSSDESNPSDICSIPNNIDCLSNPTNTTQFPDNVESQDKFVQTAKTSKSSSNKSLTASPSKEPLKVLHSKESQTVPSSKESLPILPSKESLSILPSKESNPTLPSKESLPILPSKESLPVLSLKKSFRENPSKELMTMIPKKESLKYPPMTKFVAVPSVVRKRKKKEASPKKKSKINEKSKIIAVVKKPSANCRSEDRFSYMNRRVQQIPFMTSAECKSKTTNCIQTLAQQIIFTERNICQKMCGVNSKRTIFSQCQHDKNTRECQDTFQCVKTCVPTNTTARY